MQAVDTLLKIFSQLYVKALQGKRTLAPLNAEEFREIRDREPSSCRVVAKDGDILWITEEENRVILKKEEIRRATKTWFHENPAVKLEVIEPA